MDTVLVKKGQRKIKLKLVDSICFTVHSDVQVAIHVTGSLFRF